MSHQPPLPRLVFVSAVARNGVIGLNNALPWKLPEDLAFFKKTTLGHPVLMGRATYDSIGRPLPGRTNLVLTRDPDWKPTATGQTAPMSSTGVQPGSPAVQTRLLVCGSVSDALAQVPSAGEVFVIGGAQIYTSLLAQADSLILTEIDADFAGDAVFPAWDRAAYDEVWREGHHKAALEGQPAFDFCFVRYDRKASR